MKTKRIVALVTAMMLIMSLSTLFCFADDTERDEGDRSIMNITASFSKTGNTSARAEISVRAQADVTSLTSTVCLQKWNSSESKYKTVSGSTHTKTVAGRSLNQAVDYTISSTGKYRIKVRVNDGTEIKTKYVNLT